MKFKFKEGAEANIGTEDPFYALTKGGYLNPSDVLEDEKQAADVNAAIELVEGFIDACYEEGILEEA